MLPAFTSNSSQFPYPLPLYGTSVAQTLEHALNQRTTDTIGVITKQRSVFTAWALLEASVNPDLAPLLHAIVSPSLEITVSVPQSISDPAFLKLNTPQLLPYSQLLYHHVFSSLTYTQQTNHLKNHQISLKAQDIPAYICQLTQTHSFYAKDTLGLLLPHLPPTESNFPQFSQGFNATFLTTPYTLLQHPSIPPTNDFTTLVPQTLLHLPLSNKLPLFTHVIQALPTAQPQVIISFYTNLLSQLNVPLTQGTLYFTKSKFPIWLENGILNPRIILPVPSYATQQPEHLLGPTTLKSCTANILDGLSPHQRSMILVPNYIGQLTGLTSTEVIKKFKLTNVTSL